MVLAAGPTGPGYGVRNSSDLIHGFHEFQFGPRGEAVSLGLGSDLGSDLQEIAWAGQKGRFNNKWVNSQPKFGITGKWRLLESNS